jgi:hypothetical protein
LPSIDLFVIESLTVLYDEECQFYESSEHEENINNILNQSDEAIQTEHNGSHTSLGMVSSPKITFKMLPSNS